jgi:N-acyl-D-amino-acid deacylase
MCPMRYLFCAIAIATLSASATPTQPARFDVLIKNGRVLDGSGNPWMRADVGIRDGRVVSVGTLREATAVTLIDAANRLVTPGFIDVHSHAAEGLGRVELRQARPLLAQGVTTVVVNPDGGGPIDLYAQRQVFEKGGLGPNVALLIGHGTVRRAVMRADQQRAPTDQELDEMRRLVRAAMEQGAFGLSSGLFYTPGSFAKTEEVIALAAVAGSYGGVYTSHIRDEGNYNIGVVAAVEEVIRIAEEGRLTGIVSHMKALGPDNWGLSKAAVASIDRARSRGVPVYADQYPYEASSTGLRAALLPDGVELPVRHHGAASPADNEARERVLAIIRENIRRRGGAAAIQIASFRPSPPKVGMTLEAIASKEFGGRPDVAAIEMLYQGEASIVSFNMSEEDIRHIMTRPYTMASSDGGLVLPETGQPHPRNNGAFARRLATYVRDRGVIDLEFAIRSMTSLPATVFGMKDRGTIREGAIADIAVFDLAAIRDRATYADPHQIAEGMSWVIVNGVPLLANGKFTEALPGKVLSRTRLD